MNEPVFVGETPRLGQALVGGSFDMAGVGIQAAFLTLPTGSGSLSRVLDRDFLE
ncbi:MAG TPA: hypothetical protein VKU60_10640 [Chloroflexota bacterium]|nr:hypothetical protein [Chloroflexota bacterium]